MSDLAILIKHIAKVQNRFNPRPDTNSIGGMYMSDLKRRDIPPELDLPASTRSALRLPSSLDEAEEVDEWPGEGLIGQLMDRVDEMSGMDVKSPEVQLQRLETVSEYCRGNHQQEGNAGLLDKAIASEGLQSLGALLCYRFSHSRVVSDFDEAIENVAYAVKLSAKDEVLRRACLTTLWACLMARFDRLGGFEYLTASIQCGVKAVGLTPDGNPDKPSGLNKLGILWQSRFERLGEPADLDHAIGCHSQAIDLTPDGHPNKPGYLNNLGISWQSRFQRLGELADLDHAIGCQSQAVDLTPNGHPNKPSLLNNLGISWQSRFQRLGELADLDHAIGCQSQAVDLTPDGHPNKPGYLSNLGNSWQSRFERLGELADLDHAIGCQSQAVDLTPDGHPNKPSLLNNLGNSWQSRFERLGELADLDHAIGCQSQAVDLTPDGHPDKPSRLNNLGISWQSRFQRLGELADLDHAIGCQSQAVDLTPDGHPKKPGYLNNLGISWQSGFQRLGELADLDHAIGCQSQAVDLTPNGHPNKPGYLSNLGNSWQSRFERLGELADLDHAIGCQSQAVNLTPDGHPDKPRRLNNLGISWQSRFERLGELANLDHAIGCQSQAVDLTPDGHPNKPGYLSNLGNSWQSRFERLGELADLDHAIGCQSQAFDLTLNGHPNKPGYLSNLGNSSRSRFERLGELADLDHAIGCQSQAVDLTPDGHPNKPRWLNNLGISWQSRFERLGELADLDHAIGCQSQAVDLTPDGHPKKPSLLNNLGTSWQIRFERLGELADLDHAICCLSQAVDLTPDGLPNKPGYLNNLGNSWYRRFQSLRQLVDLENAFNAYKAGATTPAIKPDMQMVCARRWATIAPYLGRSSLEAYHLAFSLLPRLVWIGQTIHYRHEAMISVRDLAAEAAACAASAHLYDLALEWLEQGRSVVWGQTLKLRTPLEELSFADPELAQKLQDIAFQLDKAGSFHAPQSHYASVSPDLVSQTAYHHQLASSWDRLLEQARLIPGFENFMRPLDSKKLKRAAKDGPVVVINTHLTQCDALIILPNCDEIRHVPLIKINQDRLERLSSIYYCMGSKGRSPDAARGFTRQNADDISRLPMLLWSEIVAPILTELGYTYNSNADELPRITWCTAGAMSFLPLHAAGLYNGSPNIFDIVVSSYAPTLTALLLHDMRPSIQMGLVAVGPEASPTHTTLPSTIHELKLIHKHRAIISYHQLEGASATVDATLAAMQQNSWVHLACHAVQNRSNPSQSAFHLYDGQLTLEEIAKRQFTNKGLAFLSACETATGDRGLPDEATHLAAGMLMAGYPSVIGTMWSIRDEDAPLVAGAVYSELLKEGKMDHSRSARALHKAVGELRKKFCDNAVEIV
ncbi:CHAT domain protein [Ceratobasidium sp. AG-Ba]|nr:CHAT domain protein [Ceratobasidium sp. AG-Ba]QRW11799.1 CHAT domain protein [Ceratobasidium sp. AG-Ba]